jgi:hypothetical protein
MIIKSVKVLYIWESKNKYILFIKEIVDENRVNYFINIFKISKVYCENKTNGFSLLKLNHYWKLPKKNSEYLVSFIEFLENKYLLFVFKYLKKSNHVYRRKSFWIFT